MLKAIPNPENLLTLEFRFTAPDDVEKYGDQWFRYDEPALIKMAARDLMRYEAEIGAPLPDVLNGVRADSVFGDTCAAWIALRQAGRDDSFDSFSPAMMLADWRVAERDAEGKAPTPETDTPGGADSPPIRLSHADEDGSPTPPTDSPTS